MPLSPRDLETALTRARTTVESWPFDQLLAAVRHLVGDQGAVFSNSKEVLVEVYLDLTKDDERLLKIWLGRSPYA